MHYYIQVIILFNTFIYTDTFIQHYTGGASQCIHPRKEVKSREIKNESYSQSNHPRKRREIKSKSLCPTQS